MHTRRDVLAALAAMGAGFAIRVNAQGSAAPDRLEFENDKVRVYRVTVKPEHDIFASQGGTPARLAVFMTEAKRSVPASRSITGRGTSHGAPPIRRASKTPARPT